MRQCGNVAMSPPDGPDMLTENPQRPNKFFGIVRFKHPHPMYPETPFLVHGVQRYGCLGRHPGTRTIFWHCPFQTPPSHVSKNAFSGLQCAEVCMQGAPAQKTPVTFCIAHSKHTHSTYPKRPFLAHGGRGIGVWGATPEPELRIVCIPDTWDMHFFLGCTPLHTKESGVQGQ